MTVPKINSAHGSDTRNIINAAIEVLNRLGIDVQTLVAEGQLTPSQYATLIKEVNGLIAKGEVKLDDLSPEILEAINNGDGTPFEILSIPRDMSVTPEKTTFIEVSSNLYDKSRAMPGVIDLFTGELGPHNNYWSTDFIAAKPNQTYTMYLFNRIIYYDKNYNRIGHYQSTNYPATEVSRENTAYIRLSSEWPQYLERAQVVEGDTINVYEPHYFRLSEKIQLPLDDIFTEENEEWVI